MSWIMCSGYKIQVQVHHLIWIRVLLCCNSINMRGLEKKNYQKTLNAQ